MGKLFTIQHTSDRFAAQACGLRGIPCAFFISSADALSASDRDMSLTSVVEPATSAFPKDALFLVL